jgi:CopG family transcriptional regulator / antitoxin EndoAI
MHQRINITLPEETIRLIDKVTSKGNRSQFIDEAVKYYVDNIGRENLKEQLKKGAIRRAKRDLNLAEEWFALEDEA